ncbi:chromate transporter [Nonomuraea sp. ZG12]|uniref:chromate transporter n=1 Tax=Nonomuraea sp. ZG12 TaxID=3452207 RepID=UPI003F88E2A8
MGSLQIAAGVCFILPPALIVTVLAWAYVTYGTTAVEGLLYGIVPVVIAIITPALFGLLRSVIKTMWLGALAIAALAAAVRLLTLGGSPSSATRPAASSPSCSPPC